MSRAERHGRQLHHERAHALTYHGSHLQHRSHQPPAPCALCIRPPTA